MKSWWKKAWTREPPIGFTGKTKDVEQGLPTEASLLLPKKAAVPNGNDCTDRLNLVLDNHEKTKERSAAASVEELQPVTERSQAVSMWDAYEKVMEKNPLMVKSATGFALLGLADLIGQGIQSWRLHGSFYKFDHGIDWLRALRFGAFGFCGAPWSHYYFHTLDRCLPPTADPFTVTTFLKVFIDQFFQAPLLLASMIAVLSLMKGQGLTGVRQDMHENYLRSLITNWKVWLPASFVNIAFVPPHLRVLYLQVAFFLWTILLSVLLNPLPPS